MFHLCYIFEFVIDCFNNGPFHDKHDFRLGHGRIMVIFALCGWFKRIFCHHSIKKFAELKISETKSSAIQNNSITLHSMIITIIVCNTLFFSTIKLQQFSIITKFTRIYNSSNSHYNNKRNEIIKYFTSAFLFKFNN